MKTLIDRGGYQITLFNSQGSSLCDDPFFFIPKETTIMNLLKKTLMVSAICAGFITSAYSAEQNNLVQVNFHGKIVATTCQLSSSEKNSTIELGTYPTDFFSSKDIKSDIKTFYLEISGCELTNEADYEENKFPASKVQLTFTDIAGGDTRVPGMLNSTTAEDTRAENIAVQVRYEASKGNFQDVFKTNSSIDYTMDKIHYTSERQGETLVNTVEMQAMMGRTNESMPTPGDVNAGMTVMLSYH